MTERKRYQPTPSWPKLCQLDSNRRLFPVPRHYVSCSLAAAALAAILGFPVAAQADSLQKSFDFNALKQKYDQQQKQQLEQGYVLENLKGADGNRTTFSLGGRVAVDDPYQQFGAQTNFRGRTVQEIDGPKVKLSISF